MLGLLIGHHVRPCRDTVSKSNADGYSCSLLPHRSSPRCAFGRCSKFYSCCISVWCPVWLLANKRWRLGDHTSQERLIEPLVRFPTFAVTACGDVIFACRHESPILGPGTGTREPMAFQASTQPKNPHYTPDHSASQASPSQWVLSAQVVRVR